LTPAPAFAAGAVERRVDGSTGSTRTWTDECKGPLRSLQRSQRQVYPPLAPHTRQRVRAGRLPQVGRGWAGSEMDSQPQQ